MFDIAKVNQIPTELKNFASAHNNIYLVSEIFRPTIFALLKKLDVHPQAVLTNQLVSRGSEISGYPLLSIDDALPNFNLGTGIIYFSNKTQTNLIMPLNFSLGDSSIILPAFVISNEESDAVYDRLTVLKIFSQYQEDGIQPGSITSLADRLVNGMSTFMNQALEDLKIFYWNRAMFGKRVYDISDTAIVIQGPLEYKDSYTAATSQIYRNYYPNVPIVISTWKGEATAEFREFCRQNAIVLLENELPDTPGFGHVNYQLESSYRGVLFVKENTNAKFVLKCRTDQRISLPNFLIYFKNLLAAFPPNGNKTERRIISMTSDWQTYKWLPFLVSDFLSFGTVNDLARLYGIPRQSRELERYQHHNETRLNFVRRIIRERSMVMDSPYPAGRRWKNYNTMMSKFMGPEVYIMKSFCNLCIERVEPERVMDIYLRFIKNYLIFVDAATILFDFPKYADRVSNMHYFPSCNAAIEIDSTNWLDIYLNFKVDEEQHKN